MPASEHNRASAVEGVMAELRRRRRLRLVLDGGLLVLAIALGLVWAARLLSLDPIAGLPAPLLISGAAGAVLVLVIAAAFVASRDLGGIARRAESRFGLAERLSTALEVDRGPRAADPVHDALMVDAGAHARAIDRRQAAPLVGASTLLGALALVIAGTGLLLANPAPPPPAPVIADTAPAAPAAGSETSGDFAEAISRMADLVAEDAEAREEGYLEAVSNALQDLAEAAPEMSREEVMEAFAALAEHATMGYGESAPEWMEGGTGELSQLGDRMAAFEAAEAARAAQEEARRAQMLADDEYGAPIFANDPEAAIIGQNLLEPAVLDPAMMQAGMEASGMAEGATPEGSALGGGMQPEPMDEQIMRPGGGMPVGAAEESGRGDSRIAGGGTQDLAENADYLRADFASGPEVMISAAETGSGNRIRIQIDPDASATAVADEAGDAGAWQRQAATAVGRHAVAPDARATVARYFARQAAAPEAGR